MPAWSACKRLNWRTLVTSFHPYSEITQDPFKKAERERVASHINFSCEDGIFLFRLVAADGLCGAAAWELSCKK